MWMGFLTGYVLPKKYYESVGAEGFEAKPVGSGPYMVDEFQQNAFLRLKANPNYWGGKPAYDTVIYKFIPDPTSRVAELEVRLLRRHAGDSLRGVRPAEGEPGLHRLLDPDLRHRDDLPQRRRPDARQERPPRRQLRHRQEGDRRPAAPRLRRGRSTRSRRRNIPPSMRRSRSPTTPPRPRSCSPPAASRRRTRSSSRSRPPAASSRRTTR